MKRALVLGASGGMGNAIVKELSNRGIEVTAFARTEQKLQRLFSEDLNVTIATGDLFRLEDLQKAARGADIIFHAANIPYPEWEEKLPVMMSNVLSVAESQSLKLAIVDNIYAYGRNPGMKVTETTPKKPHTKKGQIRLQLHQLVKDSGVPAFIAHFPDFYGPNAENTLLNFTLQNVVQNKMAGIVGSRKIPREFIFTPDGAKAMVNLALNESAYGQTWNIPSSGVITGNEILSMIRQLTNYNKPIFTVRKNMIRLLGIMDPMMREVVEMFYLNEDPVVLSGDKYKEHIGPLPRTPYEEGLAETIKYMKLAPSLNQK